MSPFAVVTAPAITRTSPGLVCGGVLWCASVGVPDGVSVGVSQRVLTHALQLPAVPAAPGGSAAGRPWPDKLSIPLFPVPAPMFAHLRPVLLSRFPAPVPVFRPSPVSVLAADPGLTERIDEEANPPAAPQQPSSTSDTQRRRAAGVGAAVPGRRRTDAVLLDVDRYTLARSLTDRDHDLLDLLAAHRVLTTVQISQWWGCALRRAQRRLLRLLKLRVLDRFIPYRARGAGSAPGHWVLGPHGADIVADRRATTRRRLGWAPINPLSAALPAQLAHRLGVNGFFTALAAHAHTHADAHLVDWWPTQDCVARYGDTIRPDAYGHWTEHSRSVRFFLEHDTGSENLARLTGKLDRYAELLTTIDEPVTVLFRFLSSDRERHARPVLYHRAESLAHHYERPVLPIATAAFPHGLDAAEHSPADPLWLPLTATARNPRRYRLSELADAYTDLL